MLGINTSYALLIFCNFYFVFGIYLTMTDLEVTIPVIKGQYHAASQTLIPMNIADEKHSQQLRTIDFYINETDPYLTINSKNGEVFVKPNSNIGEISLISSTIYARDIDTETFDKTLLQVNIFSLDKLDCDKFIKEICYWKRVTYRVDKGTKEIYLGPLSSPYWLEMCPGYDIRYSSSNKNTIHIIPPNSTKKFWSLQTAGRLYAKINVSIECNIVNNQGPKNGTKRIVDKDIIIKPLGGLRPQHPVITYSLNKKHVEKNTVLEHPQIIFNDDDPSGENYYNATIEGDEKVKSIVPNCKFYTKAVHCRLRFTETVEFTTPNYSCTLNLHSFGLDGEHYIQASLPITFNFSPPESLMLQVLKLYPDPIKIFRTAAPMARVTQPIPKKCKDCKNFSLHDNSSEIFGITSNEGIVYVNDFKKLRRAKEYVNFNISWIEGNKIEIDKVQIRIVDEPNQTCSGMKNTGSWYKYCAEYESKKECERPNVCAISTGGASSVEERRSGRSVHRCVWRGDKTSPNLTHLYSTCTPDTQTCPDGYCDSLELLNPMICPQDCVETAAWPLKLNKHTNRGIDEASWIVSCSSFQCNSIIPAEKPDNPIPTPPNMERQFRNASSEKYAGFNIGKCGTFCMLGTGGGILLLSSSLIVSMVFWRRNKRKRNIQVKYEADNQEMTAPLSLSNTRSDNPPFFLNFQMTSAAYGSTLPVLGRFTRDPKWEFPRDQLSIEQTLGEGEFGRVLRATALNIRGCTGYTTVAVKTLKDDARDTELNDLLSEYQLLREVNHPNIIGLLGVCTTPGGPVYLIIEYAEYGALRNYLRRSRKLYSDGDMVTKRGNYYDEPKTSSITQKDILSFAWQICNGMAHLSDIKLVHRDLAARNVLLTADKICKISDFGLTRDIYEDSAYLKRSKGRVPVKWMAPESLSDHLYTSKSDVWSFGVLIWELVTLGATPYPGVAIQDLFHLLRRGYRMKRPENCSLGLYKIMRSCWNIAPERRPSFKELLICWEQLLEEKMEYMNLSGNSGILNKTYFGESSSGQQREATQPEETRQDDDSSSEISPLNYLSRVQSYEKFDDMEKNINSDVEDMSRAPGYETPVKVPGYETPVKVPGYETPVKVPGYETPIKFPRKVKTPSNEDPQDYTDMSGPDAN